MSLCIEVDNLASHILDHSQANLSALGENEGRTGSIVEINDIVGTIVKQMANKVIEVNLTVFFFIYYLFCPVPIPIALS